MKDAIHQKIDQDVDESVLRQVLNILDKQRPENSSIDATSHMEELFAENDNLLKRLA